MDGDRVEQADRQRATQRPGRADLRRAPVAELSVSPMSAMDPDKPIFDALVIPPTALEQGGVEVLRAAIVDGGLHVSLRRAFDDPEAWGMLIADVARHVARIYATENQFREEETLERIRSLFNAELDSPTDPGTTSAIS